MTFAGIFRKLELTSEEANTFRLILLTSIFAGILQSIWIIIPELARNTLRAPEVAIAVLTLLWPAGQLVATYWTAYLDGKRDKSKILLLVAIFGRFPLVFGALFSRIEPIIFFFLFMVVTNPAVMASQHSIIQTNFRKEIRGKLFSYFISAQTLTSLFGVLLIGLWLDSNEQNYRWIIMIAGTAGLLEAFILSLLKPTNVHEAVYNSNQTNTHVDLFEWAVRPWREFITLFREDSAFFRFELNFFVYGLGFMIIQPFITLFLVNDLNLTYTQISLSKGSILNAGIILLSPLMGRIFDKQNPVLFSGFIFFLISFFPLLLIVTGTLQIDKPEWMIYLSYAFLSIGWTGLILVWNLGPMFFAQNRDVARYSGAHVVMVSLRGWIALVITVFLVTMITPVVAFAIGGILWFTASLLMFNQWRKDHRTPGDTPLEAPLPHTRPPMPRSGV